MGGVYLHPYFLPHPYPSLHIYGEGEQKGVRFFVFALLRGVKEKFRNAEKNIKTSNIRMGYSSLLHPV
jgi:hypothetical protein